MRLSLFSLLLLTGVLVAVSPAAAQLDYALQVSSGSTIQPSWTTILAGSRAGAGQTTGWGNPPSNNLVNLPFSFSFDGTSYSQLRVSNNGVITLGNSSPSDLMDNDIADVSAPTIMPFWDILRAQGGQNGCSERGTLRYGTSGSSPNRIFVLEWKTMNLGDGSFFAAAPVTFQTRLYETTGRIEFFYEEMDNRTWSCAMWGGGTQATTASIGIATADDFISVSPQSGGSATSSTTTANDQVNLTSTPIPDSRLYTFCPLQVTGNIAQGGTADMRSGDTLLIGKEVVITTSAGFSPFTLKSSCASGFTYTISGQHASEYSISPTSGPLPSTGNTPTITFSPTVLGKRYATLRVLDNAGMVDRTFVLAGTGIPRINWVSNPADGGSPALASGDTLMENIRVGRGETGTFSPLTIAVGGTTGPLAPVTYQLIDPSGQFSIDMTSDLVSPGSSSTVGITFTPTGIDYQTATLIVDAEGDRRTFVLRPFASGAGALFFIGGNEVTSGEAVFRNLVGCVGVDVFNTSLTIRAIGDEPFMLTTSEAFLTSSEIGPGTPPYPLLRDAFGDPVLVPEYGITENPGSIEPIQLPVVLNPGETKTVYLSFRASRPGRRFARSFFQTNGENFLGLDTDGTPVEGVLNFNLVGQGIGSDIAGVGSASPQPIVFRPTEVRSSSTASTVIVNDGDCDLFIDRAQFDLIAGDLSEFAFTSVLANTPVNAADDVWVLAPGASDSIVAVFTPARSGSRLATALLRTNDSLEYIDGVQTRGFLHLDLFGTGKVGLEARDIVLSPVVAGADSSKGSIEVENTSGDLVRVVSVEVVDPTGAIVEDPVNPWPATPFVVAPGSSRHLSLSLNPALGSAPGMRTAVVRIVLETGDTLEVHARGLVGTRTIGVNPNSLFNGVSVAAGEVRRQWAVVSNTGTFPLTITSITVTGADAASYTFAPLVRRTLDPGQVEFIEVTFAPSTPGPKSAQLEIMSNATNGVQTVVLGGTSGETLLDDRGNDDPAVRPATGAGAEGSVQDGSGLVLWRSVPNPSAGLATVRFRLPVEATPSIVLHDATGGVVAEFPAGTLKAGEHTMQLDLRHLASGRYFYTLRSGDAILALPIDLVR